MLMIPPTPLPLPPLPSRTKRLPTMKLPSSAQEKAMQVRRKFHARERELHNGRLAMVAIACLSVQSLLAGEDSLARLLGLF